MAATGKTPILLYGSTTPTNTPTAGNLTNSSDGCEIAINVADKNLFFKDATNTVNTVPIRQSSASSNGWLSSTDWSTFNSKQPAGTYVTSVTGTAPVVSSGGTTPAISMAAANGSTNGYLTSTDWTTFNGKQAALGYTPVNKAGDTMTGALTATSFSPSSSAAPANGMYLITTNTLGWSTNSAFRLQLNNNGYLSLGTSSANAQFTSYGAYDGNAPSTSSFPIARFAEGGAISTWIGGYGYTYTWLQSIQDDGSNNVKDFAINPLGGGTRFGGFIYPMADNSYSCGSAGARWSVIYAGTGTINTSDGRQKTIIGSLSDAEQAVAKEIKSLFKTFKFNSSIAEKGADKARIHVGIVAQDVKAAFEKHGLDAEQYALFCSDTWYTVDGQTEDDQGQKYTKDSPDAVEVTQLGVRYEELLSFVIAAL